MSDKEGVTSLSTLVWSCVTDGTTVNSGIGSLQSSAGLETGGEMAVEVGEEADTETVLLRQWLEKFQVKEQEKEDKNVLYIKMSENGFLQILRTLNTLNYFKLL